MAEEWIKVERRTMNKPALYDIAEQCDTDILTVRGACVTFWCWADENCDDERTGLTPSTLDRLIGLRGFADALVSVGWARIGEDGRVYIEKYEEHNGHSSKSRANDARRQTKCRERKKNANVTHLSRSCHGESVTESGRERDLEEEGELEYNGGVSRATLYKGRDAEPRRAEPAPPAIHEEDDGFADWLAAIGGAHPSVAKSRTLASDVMTEARAAFLRCPDAVEAAPLLKAYLADKLQENRHGRKFYRPTGQALFFSNLEDVLYHAELWDKETGWTRKRKRAAEKAAEKAAQAREDCRQRVDGAEAGKVCSEEEKAAIHAFLYDDEEEGK